MKIGLIEGLLYCDYKVLVNKFLDELKISYITNKNTTKKTIEDGKRLLVDESCLSLKIYFGHMYQLIDKCDYVLVIRSPSIRKNEMMCTNFYSIYDLANNLFPKKILELNIDINNNVSLEKAFINLGERLNFSKKNSKKAFDIAYQNYLDDKKEKYSKELTLLNSKKKKILLVGHSYNLMDKYICDDIKKILMEKNIEILNSNYLEYIKSNRYKNISKEIYFSKSIDLLNVIVEFKDYVDGVILISSFPCGIDSLVNEMIIRKLNLPILNLVIDELNDNSGVTTRVESFIDIIDMEESYYVKN